VDVLASALGRSAKTLSVGKSGPFRPALGWGSHAPSPCPPCLDPAGHPGSHSSLVVENLALRQPLASYARGQKRPRLKSQERAFWAALSMVCKNWRSPLLVVKPATVIEWHRRGFRLWVPTTSSEAKWLRSPGTRRRKWCVRLPRLGRPETSRAATGPRSSRMPGAAGGDSRLRFGRDDVHGNDRRIPPSFGRESSCRGRSSSSGRQTARVASRT
jgi:hypothetical protein